MEIDEINPIGVIGGILGGILSVVVMSGTKPSLLLNVLGFVITAVVCYFVVGRIAE